MPRFRLQLAYDGTDFAGWQRQTHTLETVQEYVERTLSQLYKERVVVTSASRTDSGVHSIGQTVHYNVSGKIHITNLIRAINTNLPPTIAVQRAWEAPSEFNANSSAIGKVYRYRIYNRAVPLPQTRRFMTFWPWPLDVERLNSYSELVVGEHDFESFQNKGTFTNTTVRTLYEAKWRQVTPSVVDFTVRGNGFLKQMVRNLVGTMLILHKDGESADVMARILEGRDRRTAKMTAPPQGLQLRRVIYPAELDKKCRKL